MHFTPDGVSRGLIFIIVKLILTSCGQQYICQRLGDALWRAIDRI